MTAVFEYISWVQVSWWSSQYSLCAPDVHIWMPVLHSSSKNCVWFTNAASFVFSTLIWVPIPINSKWCAHVQLHGSAHHAVSCMHGKFIIMCQCTIELPCMSTPCMITNDNQWYKTASICVWAQRVRLYSGQIYCTPKQCWCDT